MQVPGAGKTWTLGLGSVLRVGLLTGRPAGATNHAPVADAGGDLAATVGAAYVFAK